MSDLRPEWQATYFDLRMFDLERDVSVAVDPTMRALVAEQTLTVKMPDLNVLDVNGR